MEMIDYLSELENCELCEWRCGVNRLDGERGVCMIGKPHVASSMLHPAPPQSYTVFLSGCNFKCLNCQNWEIAHYPETGETVRGFLDPAKLAEEAYEAINSPEGRMIGADRIFFSGGSPTPSLPYLEKVVEEARKQGKVKVNYDTNGFLTGDSLERVLDFANSVTFDIKAYHEDVHRALTGAPVDPVLRNAKYIAENAKEKLWEFRVLSIPGMTEDVIRPISNFLSKIDPELPLNLLAFRPNYILENYQGASRKHMEKAVMEARDSGLKKVSWSGSVNLSGETSRKGIDELEESGSRLAEGIARNAGCRTHPRDCGGCHLRYNCPIKEYDVDKSI